MSPPRAKDAFCRGGSQTRLTDGSRGEGGAGGSGSSGCTNLSVQLPGFTSLCLLRGAGEPEGGCLPRQLNVRRFQMLAVRLRRLVQLAGVLATV